MSVALRGVRTKVTDLIRLQELLDLIHEGLIEHAGRQRNILDLDGGNLRDLDLVKVVSECNDILCHTPAMASRRNGMNLGNTARDVLRVASPARELTTIDERVENQHLHC